VEEVDVLIYGATPAGLTAAFAVLRAGATAVIVNPCEHVGGMVTGGIGVTDTLTPNLVGGLARQFFERVVEVTREEHPRSPRPILWFHGEPLPWREPKRWDLEPKVASRVFTEMIHRWGLKIHQPDPVVHVERNDRRVLACQLRSGLQVRAKIFIDASYEGDLMARAGVSYTWGREGSAHYGERLAGVRPPHFTQKYPEEIYETPGIEYMHHGQFGADIPARNERGALLWGVEPGPVEPPGSPDRRLQAYCFRLIVTQKQDLKVPWPAPRNYRPERYELLLRYIQAHPRICFPRLVHLAAIPGEKFDLNASGPFSIDYVGGNYGFTEASLARRKRIVEDHEDYQKGFFWFLAHDPRVPERLRRELGSWGLAKDEFVDSANWPPQLYIREGRRMLGTYIMTEHDVLVEKKKPDSVGMGSFVLDSHWVRRYEDERGFVRIEGHLDESINLARAPYQIPYRSLTPRLEDCQNLLVPVCVSASHVAYCTIRMEPVYMILGEAAGVAAAVAVRNRLAVQDVDPSLLQSRLRSDGQVLSVEDSIRNQESHG